MSPADARTKRLFASGVPVRSRARMKTQSCKALKRDVPRGSREGARAVERGLRGRRSCAGGRVMRAELDSSNRCCCGAAGRRAVWLESTGDFPSAGNWRFSHLVIHNFFTHVLQDSPSSGLSGAFSREGLA